MKRTLSTVVSGVGTLSSGVGSVVSGVGTLSAAVSTTVLNMATEDHDLADFGDSNFANDLRGRLDAEMRSSKRNRKRGQREKELSLDSGVATDTMHGMSSETEDLEADGLELEADELERVSSTTSSLSISSADEFIVGLNFQQDHPYHRESGSSVDGRDEITHVTDEYLISTDSEDSEFSLGTVEITTTEVYHARKRMESAESTSRTLGRSLNQSGNLSDFRRSTTDLSYDLTPRPLSSTPRSKSALTLSPISTEGSSTKKELSFDTFKTKSEVTLNTIKENSQLQTQRTQVQMQNFVEMSHQDPTTIDSFDTSSGSGHINKNPDLGADNIMPAFDEDEDLLEVKDPFRESFVSSGGFPFLNKQYIVEEDSVAPPTVKRSGPNNFNVGVGTNREVPLECDPGDKSVIETISEISISSKSCKIGPEFPVQKRNQQVRKINGNTKGDSGRKQFATTKHQVSKKDSADSNSTITSYKIENSVPTRSNVSESLKRKNYLTPPSQKKSSEKTSIHDSLKGSVQKDSPRSLTQRSTSCTHLNSKTEDPFTRSGTLDGFNSLDKTKSCADVTYSPQCFPTESSPTVDVADESVTVQNSSYLETNSPRFDANIGLSNFQSSSEAVESTNSGTESYRKLSQTSSASTFYSFSSEETEQEGLPNVILNGKTNKSFMTNMKNSFKRLTTFLSLSRKKEKELSPIVPVPPPQHTKPEETTRAKYRHCVRPSSPSLAQEFNQRSRSNSNVKLNNNVQLEQDRLNVKDKGDVDQEMCNISSDLNIFKKNDPPMNREVASSNKSSDEIPTPPLASRKKQSPSLMSHITNHYTSPNHYTNHYTRSSSTGPPLTGHSTVPRNYSVYKSSPGALIPSPPANRKPAWRETKASRLRLNRVKAPSMSSLNI